MQGLILDIVTFPHCIELILWLVVALSHIAATVILINTFFATAIESLFFSRLFWKLTKGLRFIAFCTFVHTDFLGGIREFYIRI